MSYMINKDNEELIDFAHFNLEDSAFIGIDMADAKTVIIDNNIPKLKRLSEEAIIPKKGSEYAAGYDLYACIPEHDIEIPAGECRLIGTGWAITPPKNMCAFIMARSGLATKQGLRPANCVGLCDYDYTGEYKVALYNDSKETRFVETGDRIAQLVFMPFYYFNGDLEIVDELEVTERGDGGFGHTGTK